MNAYTLMDGRLTADPEVVELRGDKKLTKLRLADNQPGKKDPNRPARFVTAKLFGAQGEAAARLSKGDTISATGQLAIEAYDAKDGTRKSQDVMMVDRFRVLSSDSFFAERGETKTKDGDPGDPAEDLFA